MHELSIVQNIIKIAENHARKAGATIVEGVELNIGELAGVEIEALTFAWNVATAETLLDNAALNINRTKGIAHCLDCKINFESKTFFELCPDCNTFHTEIVQGKELKIKSILVS